MNKEKVGALFFFLLSIAYGALAFQIPLTFLAQQEQFNARTMPFALSIAGSIISLLIIILPPPEGKRGLTLTETFTGLDWGRAGLLLALMVVYGLVMKWIGFVLASIIFLMAGFYILGERNIKLMLLASIPMVIGLWFLMSSILGMYIAPGEILYLLGIIK